MNMSDKMSGRVLITDDEADVRWTLVHLMRRHGFEPIEATTGKAALGILRTESVDVVLADVNMPEMNGLELLKEVQKIGRGTPVILITGFGSIESAVEAIRNGAQDYVTKPFDPERLGLAVRRALRTAAAAALGMGCSRHKRPCPGGSGHNGSLGEVMGASQRISQLIADVELVAPTNFTVLITGETGTGKEVVADSIHRLSHRAKAAFMPVDCGSITPTLMESELFGHEKGSYTGAHQSQAGKLEMASGGTLFLDEIANLSFPLQAKLLRALEERKIWRIGGTRPIDVDIRVIVAAHRDLGSMVLAKQFRKDLYYRLNEFSMVIPPLRERPDDIMFLAKRFLEYAKADLGKDIRGFSDEAAALLLSFDWPGNVRELRNIIRRAALRAEDKGLQPLVITRENLAISPGAFLRSRPIPETGKAPSAQGRFFEAAPELGEPARGPDGSVHRPSLRQTVQRTVSHVEKQVITEALIQTKGNKAEAARMLGVDYKTMHTKMKKYEICQREDKGLQPLVQPAKGESYVQT